ncbi:MAG: hypothetical protein IIC53_05515, partial [Proteobacteria bacterium]|nr:hypothetical protein [Pseudomonadota bacterium]
MAAEDPFAADYRHPPEALAMALDRALARLGEADAVSLPLLGLRARRRLLGAT